MVVPIASPLTFPFPRLSWLLHWVLDPLFRRRPGLVTLQLHGACQTAAAAWSIALPFAG
jgi:hypothetical protein